MKKIIYLSAFFSCVFISSGFCQKIRTLFYDDILYGKVKQVSQMEYLASGMGIELKDTTWYDDKGNTLEDHRRTVHGTLFKEKYIDHSDASGRKVDMLGNESNQNFSLKFDAKGNLIEYDSFFKNGTLNFKSLYDYDERNNLIIFRFFDKNGVQTQKRTYKYDDADKLIAEDQWGANGKFVVHSDFEYLNVDKMGNWMRRVAHRKSETGQLLKDLIIQRQIIYY